MKRGAPGAQRRGAPIRREVRTAGTVGAVAVRLLDLHGTSRGRDLVHVAAGGRRASDLVRVLRGLAPALDVVFFPAWDFLPYDRASPTRLVMGQRMSALD